MKSPDWEQALPPLLTQSLRSKQDGQYSLAELTRAAVGALGRRTAFHNTPPIGKDKLVQELVLGTHTLSRSKLSDDFLDVLRRGTAALESGLLALIQDTPHPYVCRTCGHMVLGVVTENCPNCGAWPETYQWFPPIYWLHALDPFATIQKLEQVPELVSSLLDGLPEGAIGRQPPDGDWNIRQTLTHMREAQEVLVYRLDLFEQQSRPVLALKAIFDWAVQENERPQTGHDISAKYPTVRGKMFARFERHPLVDWWRTGWHEEFGEVSIKQKVSYFASHEFTHLPQLQRLCG